MSDMNIGAIRNSSLFMRTVASVVLVTFTSVTVSPSVQAMQQYAAQQDTQRQVEAEERESFGKNLARAKERLRVLADRPAGGTDRRATAEQRRAAREELRAWRAEYRALKEKIKSELDATGQLLERKGVSEIIRARHIEAVATFQSETAALERDIDATVDATDDETAKARAEAAFRRLDRAKLGRSQQDFDPNNLPNSVLKPDRTRIPKTTPEAFQAALLLADPSARLAQAGEFDFSQLPGANNPSYLAATTEVVLTPDIQAKADELNRDPVAIYHWVRNNVHWQPTWGAIQDASHTLSSQRGNAFDIASLTIALLRASGIPARYVHGAIDVPEDKFRNWAGGFQHIEAAMDFASAGGIPLAAVTAGGRVTKIRMEHIWVEAAIDFHPSRGAKNRLADSWLPMDPSFKQLDILPGVDIVEVSGIDHEQLARDFLTSGTLNQAEGWGTGFNPAILQNAQARARTALENYISANLPNATVGDVLGGRRVIHENAPVLAVSLPNRIVATGARFANVPVSLQQRITFAFGMDLDGFPISPQSFAWALLNNKQVTLSFRPATPADEAAVDALIPEGGVTDISQLPTSMPAYLIHVVPELKLDDGVIMSGAPMLLGAELDFIFNPVFVSAGSKPFSYRVPAGSYLAVAVAAGSINPNQLAAARTRLEGTRTILELNDPSQTLTRERLLGDMFQAGVLGYYAQYTSMGYVAGLKQGGHHQLAAGLGSFGYEPNVDYFFGVPRRLTTGGAAMNVPIVNVVGKDAPAAAGAREYATYLGAISSTLEHAVPEQMFASMETSGEAISAVKALSKASAAGQRIYEITRTNQYSILPLIHHDPATVDEIRAALAAGKTVITHTNAVSVPGWSGAGYILMDSETGAAAWKIGGGANGGYYSLTGLGLGLVAGVAAVVAAPWVITLVFIISIIITIINFLTLSNELALEFGVSRILGFISGVALAIILGQFVFIAFPVTFYLGFLFLLIMTLRLFVIEIFTLFSYDPTFRTRNVRMA